MRALIWSYELWATRHGVYGDVCYEICCGQFAVPGGEIRRENNHPVSDRALIETLIWSKRYAAVVNGSSEARV